MAASSLMQVAPRERYRDVAHTRWPVAIEPHADELLSSWLHRLAHANGVAPRDFAQVLGLRQGMWSARLDVRLPKEVLNRLSERSGFPNDRLLSLALQPRDYRRMPLPLHIKARRAASMWLQFCPACLASDEHPYFRKRWRHSTGISCFIHGCGLRDRCPSCHHGIAAFAQPRLVAQYVCACCAYDLRRASKVPVTIEAQFFDLALSRSIVCAADLIAMIRPSNGSKRGDVVAHLPAMSVSRRIRLFESFIPDDASREECFDLPIRRRSPAYGPRGPARSSKVNIGETLKLQLGDGRDTAFDHIL